MLKLVFTFFILLTTGYAVVAQGLYMPRNITQAYANGTRDKSGKPGKAYWQNRGRYDIQITVKPPSRTVYGTEAITYINNSPDNLKQLIIRLICNIHKMQAPRSGYTSMDFLTDGVMIDRLVVGEHEIPFNNDVGTVATVNLPEPLNSKDSVQLKIDWHYDLSKQSGREGMIDSTTLFLAYFYPRISVYDDYNHWDRIEHTNRGEFYSDFNDYTVSVTAPANYVVWGTGTLMNAREVLNPGFADRLESSYSSGTTLHIATKEEMLDHKVIQQKQNTWKFKADNIADMTLGISDHYVWDASSVVVDSFAKRRASVQAAYNDTSKDFHHSVDFARNALYWYSRHLPGVAYPFPTMTAFQGYADMEYPMMVNDNSTGDDLGFAQLVQDHEIAHTYFPFYMGINETRYAYMDEGWATTFEYLIAIAEKGKAAADTFYQQFRVQDYIHDASGEEDQPIITQSNQVSGVGYGHNSYGKASLAYLGMKDLLGEVLFKKALHVYMDNWHGKHPIPWDFFNSFTTASGQDLNWYWKNWFFSNNYIDLDLTDVQVKGGKAVLLIKNTGGFAIPFDVIITYQDGSTSQMHQSPAVWKGNEQQLKLSVTVTKKPASVRLDGNIFMDATPENNLRNLR